MADLSPEERRAIENATSTIAAVRLAQIICAGFGLWDLLKGDWKGFLIMLGLALLLGGMLPRVDPGVLKKLERLSKR